MANREGSVGRADPVGTKAGIVLKSSIFLFFIFLTKGE